MTAMTTSDIRRELTGVYGPPKSKKEVIIVKQSVMKKRPPKGKPLDEDEDLC